MSLVDDIAEGRASRPQGERDCPAADAPAALKNNQDLSKVRSRGGSVARNLASEPHGHTGHESIRARDPDADRRKLWRAYHLAYMRACEALEREADAAAAIGVSLTPTTQPPPFPEILRGLRCGARTRKGTACKRGDLYLSGRCALHGGKSTGPATPEGQDRARANLALRWADRDPMR